MLRRTTLLLSSLLLPAIALASVSITAIGTGSTAVQARIAAEFQAQLQCHQLGTNTISIHFVGATPVAGGGWQASVGAECGDHDGPPYIYP